VGEKPSQEVIKEPLQLKIVRFYGQMDETICQINAFQHVRPTKSAEACPCGWKPGKKTLKPGPALVGNV